MVRLKVSGAEGHYYAGTQFQFHMVRLKADPVNRSLYAIGFQFHMVRLKGTAQSRRRSARSISIPYGTIKSRRAFLSLCLPCSFQFHMVRLKVELVLVCVQPLSVFQFHMVRLKAAGRQQRAIPQQFQFHMVRLKA